ncbi:hypothetical protein MJH12_18045, partial [bacterium]|nr:hypothetical protein [bacterium]
MGIGIVHYTVLTHQQKQSSLIERELSSFYIAEAGYQWLFAKLKFDKTLFFQQAPNGKQDFFYKSKRSLGYFEYFISQSKDSSSKAIDLSILIRGVFEDAKSNSKDITLISSSMVYEKIDGAIKVVVKDKAKINLRELFVFAKDSNFSSYFKNSNLLSKIKSKQANLVNGSLTDPSLMAFWNDVNQLVKVNQVIKNDLKLVQRLKRNEMDLILATLNSQDKATDISKMLIQQKEFHLVKSSSEISRQIQAAKQDQIETSLKREFVQKFRKNHAQHQSILLSPSNSGFLKLSSAIEMPINDFINIMEALIELMPGDSFKGFIDKLDQHQVSVTEPSALNEGKKKKIPLKSISEDLSKDSLVSLEEKNRKASNVLITNHKTLAVNLDFPTPIADEFVDQDEFEADQFGDVSDLCHEIGGRILDDGRCDQDGEILDSLATLERHCTEGGGIFKILDGGVFCEELGEIVLVNQAAQVPIAVQDNNAVIVAATNPEVIDDIIVNENLVVNSQARPEIPSSDFNLIQNNGTTNDADDDSFDRDDASAAQADIEEPEDDRSPVVVAATGKDGGGEALPGSQQGRNDIYGATVTETVDLDQSLHGPNLSDLSRQGNQTGTVDYSNNIGLITDTNGDAKVNAAFSGEFVASAFRAGDNAYGGLNDKEISDFSEFTFNPESTEFPGGGDGSLPYFQPKSDGETA